jgi:hypothetical protein
MNDYNNYIAAVDLRTKAEKDDRSARCQEAAIAQRAHVLERYQKCFPVLWEHFGQKMQDAPTVFLNNGESNAKVGLSGFGAPGVLVDGLIFAVYRNSYCYSFHVGIYNGTEPVVQGGEVLSEKAALCRERKMADLLKSLVDIQSDPTFAISNS